MGNVAKGILFLLLVGVVVGAVVFDMQQAADVPTDDETRARPAEGDAGEDEITDVNPSGDDGTDAQDPTGGDMEATPGGSRVEPADDGRDAPADDGSDDDRDTRVPRRDDTPPPPVDPGGEEDPSSDHGDADPDRSYVTKAGDSLWEIAELMYGDGTEWRRIFEANRDVLPSSDSVPTGVTLRIPGLSGGSSAADDEPTAPSGNRVHVVRSGETLSHISRKWYGTAGKWRKIHEANKSVIGTNPNALKEGMRLTIPPE